MSGSPRSDDTHCRGWNCHVAPPDGISLAPRDATRTVATHTVFSFGSWDNPCGRCHCPLFPEIPWGARTVPAADT